MPRATGDSSTGWWSIRIRMPDNTRKKFPLIKQPGWVKGKKLPRKAPPDVELLARKYQDMHVQFRHGVGVSAVRADALKAFLAEYRAHYATGHRPNSLEILDKGAARFLAWCDAQGVATVQQVGVAVCERYMQSRLQEGAARNTVAVEKGILAPAWSRAVRARSLAENPWKLAPIPGKDRAAEPEYWTADEVEKLVGAARGWVRDVILVALNCGGRMTAVLSLRRRDVKFDRGVVRLDGKTGAYEVPMSPVLRDVLQRLDRVSKVDHVFPDRTRKKARTSPVVYAAILKVVRKAGLPEKGSYCHSLRHTFASHAIMRGVPLVVVSKWLGHKSITQTMRYSHLAQSESSRMMQSFSLGHDPLQNVIPPPSVDDPTDKPLADPEPISQ